MAGGSTDRAGSVLGGTALAVLGLSVLLFTFVGAFTPDDGATPQVAASPSTPDAQEPPADESPAAQESPTAPEDPEPAPEDAEPEPSDEPEPEPEPSPETSEPTVDPATVTVQVLDADGADGRATTDAVADVAREAGYNVVVVNDAVRVYEATTVFYTAGNETAANELAAAIGGAEVALKPDNLSDSVALHLVVGADRV